MNVLVGVDDLSDTKLYEMLRAIGPCTVERMGETLDADYLVDINTGVLTFAVGHDRISMLRSDIINITPRAA